ncbi:MAG TPA: H-X9-DG-CTERM domain-containing protein [Lacipirellulaceae bacterium]|nr:H-X9-DG-CTERM domain-containing protein [Lacipirellulaceae bacterium]
MEQTAGRETSYAMNGYLQDPAAAYPPPLPPGVSAPEGMVGSFYDLAATHATILMFEAGPAVAGTFDHVESDEWFSERNRKHNATQHSIAKVVQSEVALARHHGAGANYLYADGHVALIPAHQVTAWCDEGFDFAKPPL